MSSTGKCRPEARTGLRSIISAGGSTSPVTTRSLTEVDIGSGKVSNEWPLAGAPDVTFLNPTTGLVHVAIGRPGLVQSVDPRTGRVSKP